MFKQTIKLVLTWIIQLKRNRRRRKNYKIKSWREAEKIMLENNNIHF